MSLIHQLVIRIHFCPQELAVKNGGLAAKSGILYILSIQAFVILSIQSILAFGATKSQATLSKNKIRWRTGREVARDTDPLAPWIKL